MEPSKGFKEIHHRIEPLFLEEGSLRFLRLTCFFRREAGGQICLTKNLVFIFEEVPLAQFIL